MANAEKITVSTTVNAPVDKVWKLYNEPEHITQWNHASDEWHSPRAENDLRPGGKFLYRMEAKDGSFGFDFGGTYNEVVDQKRITYNLDDTRAVSVDFDANGDQTTVTSIFDADTQNPVEMQQQGWQAILNNFRKYVESLN